MFCPKCGKGLPDNAMFCDNCGTRLVPDVSSEENVQQASWENQQPVQPEAPRQEAPVYGAPQAAASAAGEKKSIDIQALLNNKLVWICLGAVIVVIIAIIIIANAASSSGGSSLKGTPIKTPYTFLYTSDGTYVYKADKEITKFDSYTYSSAVSDDQSAYACIDGDNVLYLISGDKSVTVDSDVTSVYMSDDGSTLVYRNDDKELWYYRNGSKKKIAEIDSDYSPTVRISPNGDTVVYAVDESSKTVTYIYSGNKAEELATKLTPISVSNGGSVIYAENTNGKLGYIKNKKGDDFETVRSLDGSYTLSEDKKSLIFYSSSSTYYFDTSLEDAIKITSGWISLVLPYKTTETVPGFKNFLGMNDGKIYRFELKRGDFEKTKIVSGDYNYQVSPDGSSIIYLKNGKLHKVDTKTGENDDVFATINDEDIAGFIAIPDFSGFYLVNEDDDFYSDVRNLYYVGKNGGEAKKPFAEDVYRAALNDSGVIVYLTDYSGGSGTLYYSSRGDKGKKVSGIGECTSYLYTESSYSGSTIYVYDEDDTLYISTNGKDFKKTNVER